MHHDEAHEQVQCPGCTGDHRAVATLSRRDALRLGAAAGATAALAPRVGLLTGASRAEAITAIPTWPAPPIVTRAQWGANEALRKPGADYDSKIEKLIVHHTVTPNNPSDPAAVVRSVYSYALSQGYLDLPYNFLIDHKGRIYEGRWARDYPSGVAHTGEDAQHRQVRGAHALYHNSRTIGVALLGTYTYTAPPTATVNALVTLLTWKCARWGIDPRGATPYLNSTGATVVIPNMCGHRDTKPTACPGDPMWRMLSTVREQVAARLRGGTAGYYIAGSDGFVGVYGDMPDVGSLRTMGIATSVHGIAAHPSGRGYWLWSRDGAVFSFGASKFYGSKGGQRLPAPVAAMLTTSTGRGYLLVCADGTVYPFGDAVSYGGPNALPLAKPIVGICPTPSGLGYWMVASDGGVFSYGDARFRGSAGAIPLVQPIVGMSTTPTGNGYWLVAADGGVFTYGDARFFGSGFGKTSQPVRGMLATSTGNGYGMVCRDGRVLVFGDARHVGDATGKLSAVGFSGKMPRK